MKNHLLLLAALSLSAAAPTLAQAPVKTTGSDANQNALHQKMTLRSPRKEPKTPAQKADRKAAKMAQGLGLTADQEARVGQLMLAHQQETAALKAKYAADKKAGRPEMKAAHDRYENQLKAIMTPAQYAKFGQLNDKHHGHGNMPHPAPAKGKAKS